MLISGRSIAWTFWGKAWCQNLERYSDYDNRLPRGRSYVRNGSVIDLQIADGTVTAKVHGSQLYTSTISVKPLPADRWKALRGDCAGGIDSLVELLQGRFSNAVMGRLCDPRRGLFPAPAELGFTCSCPDWASMCKHVAAALYGVGARLDSQPELLFLLRQVDQAELIDLGATPLTGPGPADGRVLDDSSDLSALFGLDLEGPALQAAPAPPAPRRAKGGKTADAQATSSSPRRTTKAKPATGAASRAKPRTAITPAATTRNVAAKAVLETTVGLEKTLAKPARKATDPRLANPEASAKSLVRPATASDGKPTAQSATRRTAKSSKATTKQLTTAKLRVRDTAASAASAAVEQTPQKDPVGTRTSPPSRKVRQP